MGNRTAGGHIADLAGGMRRGTWLVRSIVIAIFAGRVVVKLLWAIGRWLNGTRVTGWGPAPKQMPRWILAARTFIATAQDELLHRATEICPDPEIRAFLACGQLLEGQLRREQFQPLVESLRGAKRATEAAAIELLALRRAALRAGAPRWLSAEISQLAVSACNRAAAIAGDMEFPECQAVFAWTLGNHAAGSCQWGRAAGALGDAVGLYRSLAADEPGFYRAHLAVALANMGNALRKMRRFGAARAACEEVVAIRRELAADAPKVDLPNLATALNSLAGVLEEMGQWPAAIAACAEALTIHRELASSGPGIYRTDVARTLNNLGRMLQAAGRREVAGDRFGTLTREGMSVIS